MTLSLPACVGHATSAGLGDGASHSRCLLRTEGVKAEALYAKDKTLPDPTSTDNPEYQIVLSIIKEGLPKHPTKWTDMAREMEGVSEETTTGVKRLYEMQVGLVHAPPLSCSPNRCSGQLHPFGDPVCCTSNATACAVIPRVSFGG